jgi:hypothetical protein
MALPSSQRASERPGFYVNSAASKKGLSALAFQSGDYFRYNRRKSAANEEETGI